MVRSMTGFGRATGDLDGERITIELSSVNHRFLECQFRMPHAWASLEGVFRDQIKKMAARGKVNISIRRAYGPLGRQQIQFNADTADQYLVAAGELAKKLGADTSLSLDTLAQLDGVFTPADEEQDLRSVRKMVSHVLTEALQQLEQARTSEGEALTADIRERIAQMRDSLRAVEMQLPEISEAYAARLQQRVSDLNAEPGVKEERLAIEIALMADKTDVNEEIVRLKAHFEHVEELLVSQEPVGRDLNFLTQEIQREINTLGSKMRDIGITRETLRMKSELEKLREQIQNVE